MMNPKLATLKQWAASLIIDFPNDEVPLLQQEQDWREWGDALIQEGSFSRNGAPDTRLYQNWTDWAEVIFYAMANF
jgi:hypothetical protein